MPDYLFNLDALPLSVTGARKERKKKMERDYAELIEAWRYCVESKTCDGCPMYKNCPDINHQIVAADAIEELLAAVPKWISVEERLPEQGERYLVTGVYAKTNERFTETLWYDGSCLWWNRFYKADIKITHWMPLPEPPKEVQDG